MKHLNTYKQLFESYGGAREKVNRIVHDLLKKYRGGRPFFDALDASIKSIVNNDIIQEITKDLSDKWVTTSGEFGDMIYDMWKDNKFKCKGVLVFNGKMCTNKIGVTCWYPDDFDIENKKFVFVDDSLFSGSTANKIDDYLSQYNSSIERISVVYDGSKERNNKVKSLFRYYKN